jgi:hypothetical protein
MKTLEQTLEELKQLEQLINTRQGTLSDDQLEVIADQLSNAFELAQGELNKIEAESKIKLDKIQNDEE